MFAHLSRWLGSRRARPTLAPAQQERLAAWQRQPEADFGRHHDDSRYVVVDVESSGLHPQRDHLISIGAVGVGGGVIDFADVFQVVLRQEKVSSDANILIHGIGSSAQSEGAEPAEALLAFLDYLGKAPLVAYHAFFDRAMIDKAMRNTLGVELGLPWIDLAWLLPHFFATRGDPLAPLDSWLARFGIAHVARHNALADAYATAQLLQMTTAAALASGAASPASLVEIEKSQRWLKGRR